MPWGNSDTSCCVATPKGVCVLFLKETTRCVKWVSSSAACSAPTTYLCAITEATASNTSTLFRWVFVKERAEGSRVIQQFSSEKHKAIIQIEPSFATFLSYLTTVRVVNSEYTSIIFQMYKTTSFKILFKIYCNLWSFLYGRSAVY